MYFSFDLLLSVFVQGPLILVHQQITLQGFYGLSLTTDTGCLLVKNGILKVPNLCCYFQECYFQGTLSGLEKLTVTSRRL